MAGRRGRVSSYERGRAAEQTACDYLAAKGYRVAHRNMRLGPGEIDLVAWDGDVMVFVEVKARGKRDYGLPEEAVGPGKRRRLVEAAGAFLAERPGETPVCRFDVVAVDAGPGNTKVRHLVDAFRPGE